MCARRADTADCPSGVFLRERSVQSKMEEMNAKQAERERGFTILGVLIAVLIMGTMAAVAVPKFSGAMAAANTSRIQADLAAIDTAIALYSIDKGGAHCPEPAG